MAHKMVDVQLELGRARSLKQFNGRNTVSPRECTYVCLISSLTYSRALCERIAGEPGGASTNWIVVRGMTNRSNSASVGTRIRALAVDA